jgi:hypothetical protein
MNEALFDSMRDPSDGTDSRLGVADRDPVTTRRPPVPRPPPKGCVARPPPPPVAGLWASSYPPPLAASSPEHSRATPGAIHSDAQAGSRTSFWRAALRSSGWAWAPDAVRRGALEFPIAVSSAALALVTFAFAMFIGLAAPSKASIAPTVSAAVVIARALIALGLMAFSVVLLWIGERRLTAHSRATSFDTMTATEIEREQQGTR